MTETCRMKLTDAHEDELRDVEKYRSMADGIEKDHPRAAGVLRDIARDEESHAREIKHILDMGK